MNRFSVIVFTLMVLAAAGCKQPTQVELKPPDEGNVVISPVAPAPDSVNLHQPVTYTALLPDDQEEYAGIIILNNVKYDSAGIRSGGAYSWVFFADRKRPFLLPSFGSSIGFYGFSLPSLTLNGSTMTRVPHILQGPHGVLQFQWGWEYVLDLTSAYQPNMGYRWHAGADSVGAIDVMITSADSLKVLSPLSGAIVSRTSDLMLRWIGQGDMTIILSEITDFGDLRPMSRIHVYKNVGKYLLSSNWLQLLEGKGAWFTFVLANRNDESSVAGYNANVLVQAASVYNIYVRLH